MSRGAHKRWSRFGKIGFFSFPAFVPIWRVGPPGHAAGKVELKGELKMAVHSGFLSYRNVETKRGARPREEEPFIGGHVREASLGVSKLKKRNRGCVNLYGKKMTTERGGHSSQKLS